MQKRMIYIFLGVVAAVIILIVIIDISGSRPEKRGENPFALEVDDFMSVDPDQILYRETKNIKLLADEYYGIDVSDSEIFITADNYLQVLSLNGVELRKIVLPEPGGVVLKHQDELLIGFRSYIASYNLEGRLINEFPYIGDSAVVTSIAVIEDNIFVADAGNRQVLRYGFNGNLINSFKGKREADDLHGFIIPSPYFDVANNDGDLWVVNPGMHALENYSLEGDLRGYWEKANNTPEGFAGCCNPAYIDVMPNGSFVTSEKGIVRIKVFEQSGKLTGFVAEPSKFEEDGHAPDIAVGADGVIYALDFDRKLIRVFEKKS